MGFRRLYVTVALLAAGFSAALTGAGRAEPRDSGPAGGAFMSSYTRPPVTSPAPRTQPASPPVPARQKPRGRR